MCSKESGMERSRTFILLTYKPLRFLARSIFHHGDGETTTQMFSVSSVVVRKNPQAPLRLSISSHNPCLRGELCCWPKQRSVAAAVREISIDHLDQCIDA